jgi:hypothetical protein
MKKTLSKKTVSKPLSEEYGGLIGGIAELLEASRRIAARTVNALMTATYWEIGRRIVEFEQRGKKRAEYGKELLQRLAQDLTARLVAASAGAICFRFGRSTSRIGRLSRRRLDSSPRTKKSRHCLDN